MLKAILYFLFSLLFISCKNDHEKQVVETIMGDPLQLKYAKGFSVEDYGIYKILEIKNPWPKAEKVFKYVLINKENAAKTIFPTDAYDGILIQPIQKIVVTSTTHIPALELLNIEETLIGFPGIDYIS